MNLHRNILFENGHLNDEAVALYTDALMEGNLTEIPELVLIHVEECTPCKDKIIDLSLFLRNPDTSSDAVRTADASNASNPSNVIPMQESLDASRKKGFLYPVMRIAAMFFTATLLLGAYFMVYEGDVFREFTGLDTPDTGSVEQPTDAAGISLTTQSHVTKRSTGPAAKPNVKKVSDNLKVNPNLEHMIDGSYRGATVRVLSPLNNVTLKDNIVFAWENVGTTKPQLTLKILDNKNKIAHECPVKGTSFSLKQKLAPGLYYWKLESKKDLFHTGKFFIK
ncbi:MAG: hypothetical protein GY757_15655 [bacterium]|nr:hypothetical protein [bacterium]